MIRYQDRAIIASPPMVAPTPIPAFCPALRPDCEADVSAGTVVDMAVVGLTELVEAVEFL